jgi:hypothetical protein
MTVIVIVIMIMSVIVAVFMIMCMAISVFMIMLGTVAMSMAVFMIMLVAVTVTVFMPMGVFMFMFMAMGVLRVVSPGITGLGTGLVRPVGGLGQRIVLVEGRVVAMPVPPAIGARFRLERRRGRFSADIAQLRQHVGQNRIELELQEVFADFEQHMAIAQVVGRARQLAGRVGANPQHGFVRRPDENSGALVVDEHIPVTQHDSAVDGQTDFLAVIQDQPLAAAPALGQGERHRRRALGPGVGSGLGLRQIAMDDAHG